MASSSGMESERIDFISAYCDRWCERCSFRSRCSAFAVQAAIAMTGDTEEGLELAIGRPRLEEEPAVPGRFAEFESGPPSEQEVAELVHEHRQQRDRVDDARVMVLARSMSKSAYIWLKGHGDATLTDPVLAEALAIAAWDAGLIAAKLRRALMVRDDGGDDDIDNRLQHDSDGTAKVALISIERSAHAWLTIAEATGEDAPAAIAADLADLRLEVEALFPKAWQFIRPGFDDCGRE